MKKHLPEILVAIASILLIILIAQYPYEDRPLVAEQYEDESIEEEDNTIYGIPMDSLYAEFSTIKPGQNLSEILTRAGLSMQLVDRLARISEDIFDVRRIRAGNRYALLRCQDTTNHPWYFVYENTPEQYVVFDLRDSIRIYFGEKEVEKRQYEVAGSINNSLWLSIRERGVNPYLAIRLSDIFAWTVDFYGIDKGDQYKVIYEQLYVDDEPIRLGKVKAAWFKHSGRPFYAFYFEQDTLGDYFDEEGNSLRREFLKAPLNYSRISSRFSYSRMHPIHRVRRPHLGVDYAAPHGTPVQSIGDGKVIHARYSGGAGHYVKIRHNSVYTTGYMHLSRYGEGIRPGRHVKQGDIIGYVGSTGTSTGPHLDFRFFKNGQPVDPLKVESPPANPVDSNLLPTYLQYINTWKQRLDAMDQTPVMPAKEPEA